MLLSLSSLLLSTSEMLGVGVAVVVTTIIVVVVVVGVVGEARGGPKRAMPRHRINQSMESDQR
jgi:hypothetical protein